MFVRDLTGYCIGYLFAQYVNVQLRYLEAPTPNLAAFTMFLAVAFLLVVALHASAIVGSLKKEEDRKDQNSRKPNRSTAETPSSRRHDSCHHCASADAKSADQSTTD